MEDVEYEMTLQKHHKRIVVAVDKAIDRPELLPYLRTQIIASVAINVQKLTDTEVNEYYEKHYGQTKDKSTA